MSFDDIAARIRNLRRDPSANHSAQKLEDVYLLRARILGVLIRDARQTARLEVEDLAEQVGVAPETVVEWEFGRVMPSLSQLELVGYALEVPVSYFWGTELLQSGQRRAVNADEYVELRDRLIGALLRAAREQAKLTPEQLAAEAGLDAETILAYEFGQWPIPMPVLMTLASACGATLAYFLEHGNRIGEFLALQEDLTRFSELPEELRHFVSTPTHQPYLELAMKLARLDTDELRGVAEAILEITL